MKWRSNNETANRTVSITPTHKEFHRETMHKSTGVLRKEIEQRRTGLVKFAAKNGAICGVHRCTCYRTVPWKQKRLFTNNQFAVKASYLYS
jgi:hypothetical protein